MPPLIIGRLTTEDVMNPRNQLHDAEESLHCQESRADALKETLDSVNLENRDLKVEVDQLKRKVHGLEENLGWARKTLRTGREVQVDMDLRISELEAENLDLIALRDALLQGT